MPELAAPSFELMQAVFPGAADLRPERALVRDFLRSQLPPLLAYKDLAAVRDNGEAMEPVVSGSTGPKGYLVATQELPEMRPFTGNEVEVREGVIPRLIAAAEYLGAEAAGHKLEVNYGYRPLSVQQEYFDEKIAQLVAEGFEGTDDELLMAAHRLVAYPEVAGHPTGGAVDVRVIGKDDKLIDTGITDDDSEFLYWPFITTKQWKNRQLLVGAMREAGMWVFAGESNHFDHPFTPEGTYYEQQALQELNPGAGLGRVALYRPLEYVSSRAILN